MTLGSLLEPFPSVSPGVLALYTYLWSAALPQNSDSMSLSWGEKWKTAFLTAA